MDAKSTIYVKFETYGYVASSPDFSSKTQKCNGPRAAADRLASAMYGEGRYTLTPRSSKRKIYDVVPITPSGAAEPGSI
jgi:hypothetical protein